MTRIIISGAGGRMGKTVTAIAEKTEGCRIVAGVDLMPFPAPFPVFSSIEQVSEKADAIIDFSHHSALPDILKYAKAKNLPAVLCTTGYSDDEKALIREYAKTVPLFFSANMSLGINLVRELIKKCATVLTGYDIEIIEKHHREKLDAPSGTALLLADSMKSVMPQKPEYVYDRTTRRERRPENEIGIHSVRGGTIVGEHDVIFAGNNEVITVSHNAESRDVFAAGAVRAAVYVAKAAPGLHDMSDMLKEYFSE